MHRKEGKGELGERGWRIYLCSWPLAFVYSALTLVSKTLHQTAESVDFLITVIEFFGIQMSRIHENQFSGFTREIVKVSHVIVPFQRYFGRTLVYNKNIELFLLFTQQQKKETKSINTLMHLEKRWKLTFLR